MRTAARRENGMAFFCRELGIEAYSLEGNARGFPDHFHNCYVVGFVLKGARVLRCAGKSYELRAGDVMTLNPGDSHGCSPLDGALDYRAFNISRAVMARAARELARTGAEPRFAAKVAGDGVTFELAAKLYAAAGERAPKPDQEAAFLALIERLLPGGAAQCAQNRAEETEPVARIRRYIEKHYAENISLDRLLSMTDLTKFSMIRRFAGETGLTPYHYLQAVRLGRAKEFLRRGLAPAEAADAAGFADQSHLTNYFREFTGLTPKQYQKIFTE